MRLRTTGQISLALLLGSGMAAAQAPKPVAPSAPAVAAAPPPAAPVAAQPAPAAAPTTTAPKPVAPKPAPELDQLAWLVGNWRCDGKAPAGALGPGSPAYDYKSKMTLKKDLKDFVLSADYEQAKTKANPLGYHG